MTLPYPTVADYLSFAERNGCSVTSQAISEPRAEAYAAAVIRHPNGRQVRSVFVDRTDVLMSSTIAHLDRRLGVKSYFFV
jgi:hypothetical protein